MQGEFVMLASSRNLSARTPVEREETISKRVDQSEGIIVSADPGFEHSSGPVRTSIRQSELSR